MLKLIEGGLFAGGHEMIIREIEILTKANKQSFLIVPEQQTVVAEREMTDFLPSSAPLVFEVTNFTRFANTLFRTLGGLNGKHADSLKKSLLMWRTLNELSLFLESAGASSDISYGRISKMLNAVKELQTSSLDAKSLADAAKQLSDNKDFSDPRLIAKLLDISKIISLYKSLLKENYSDSDDELIMLAKKMKESDKGFLEQTHIFIDGFTSFTEPQYSVIRELIKECNVTLFLGLPKNNSEAYEYKELKNTHSRIVKIASECGVDINLHKIDGVKGAASLLVSEIGTLIWRSSAKADKEIVLADKDSLSIFEADSPYEECEFVAEDIKRRVMEGDKYSDFAVIARNISDFIGILDIAFDKADIPLFISKKDDLASYEIIKLIQSAYSAVTRGYDKRDIISYSKCSLCGISRDEADEFELYVEKWQITGSRFTDGIFWNMNPLGFSDFRDKNSEEKLLRIDAARQKIITPLMLLEENVKEAKTVKEHSMALVNFLLSLRAEEHLQKMADDFDLQFGNKKGDGLRKIFKTVCDILDSLCEILGDIEVTREVFSSLLKISFTETDIGQIPTFTEQVIAASADTARIPGKKHIYIIGANASVFPASSADDSYFSDNDKRTLSDLGLTMNIDSEIKSARELYIFQRALSFAKKSISILYHTSDSDFKSTAKSEAVTRITELTDNIITPVKISEIPFCKRAYSPYYVLEHNITLDDDINTYDEALIEAGYKDFIEIRKQNITNSHLKLKSDTIKSLYGASVKMSQSKLDKFLKCPMSYFCTYNLKLSSNEKAEFDTRSIGNFIHSILENFFGELKKRGKRIGDISEEEKQALVLKTAEDFTSTCFEGIPSTSARLKDTISKLSRAANPIVDSLCRELKDCKYEPVFFELEIDKNAAGNPEASVFKTSDGREVYLSGKIDRVDTYKKDDDVYVRVIDYKSGNKVFSPSDIESGENMQMFLYLKSIVETKNSDFKKKIGAEGEGKMIPAGVIYVKTSMSDTQVNREDKNLINSEIDKKNRVRLGMLLDDYESINAMNPSFIPIKFNSKGEPDAYSKSKLYTDNGWKNINDTIEKSVTSICEKMFSGDIEAAPINKKSASGNVCKWCDFKPICRNASRFKKS